MIFFLMKEAKMYIICVKINLKRCIEKILTKITDKYMGKFGRIIIIWNIWNFQYLFGKWRGR